jgi:hypothetical protein
LPRASIVFNYVRTEPLRAPFAQLREGHAVGSTTSKIHDTRFVVSGVAHLFPQ